MPKACQVIILGAGLGTGLYPLSIERPKVLAPVCNTSLLEYMLGQLRSVGINAATLVLRPSAETSVALVKATVPDKYNLRICYTPHLANGTVPAVRFTAESGATSFLVIYGDSLIAANFRELLEAHERNKTRGCVATLLYHRPDDIKSPGKDNRTYHGIMVVDHAGRITGFAEKPLVSSIREGSSVANAAVFVCERSLLEEPMFATAKDFSYDVFERASSNKTATLCGHDIGGGFRLDVGSLRRLFEINMDVLSRRLEVAIQGHEVSPGIWLQESSRCDLNCITPPVVLGRGVRIGAESRVGPHAVIGNDTVIGKRSHISRALVMEGTRVGCEAKIERSIIGPFANIGDEVCVPPQSVLGPHSTLGNFRV